MVKVIFEDNMIVVVEKRAGLLTQSDHTGEIDLLTEVKQYIKTKYKKQGNVFIGLVHRLDRNVGGVMVFARNSKNAARLSEDIRSRRFKKIYLCVVEGDINEDIAVLTNYLLKDQKTNTVRVLDKEIDGAKFAKLGYKVISRRESLSLVEVELETGRPHQIRAQLSHLGFPIFGDKKYGSGNKRDDNQIALWSHLISFTHPTTKTNLTFISAPPPSYPWNLFQIS